MADIAYTPPKKAQASIVDFAKSCFQLSNSQWNIRGQLEAVDRAYMREVDCTTEQAKAKAANAKGDTTKFQNIVMPVVMPQVESAVTYQQSVFLTGSPIFSAVSVPEFAEEAAQMDTIMGEQQVHGNWVHEILTALRDGFKYNLMAVEVDWKRKVSAALETDLAYKGGQEGRPTELIWAGNAIKRIDLYNAFWDTRVDPKDIASKGEFAGYHENMSRIAFKAFLAELPTRINVKEACESGSVSDYYYPSLNPEALLDSQPVVGTNWAAWGGWEQNSSSIKYKDVYQVTTLYGRILPSDMGFIGLPAQNTPQVWKFIIVNNEVVVFAERLTNAHNLLPMIFAQPLDDGLAYQTKSFARNVEPIQAITTALSNSSIAARRRAISDRMLYDPSRVSPGAINNDSPTAKIPVRPSAYQQELSRAVYPLPFRDDQFQINMAEIQSYRGMANEISGLNPARQGQFVKGNKTKFEYADIMANANGRDMTVALTLEGNFFAPIKEIIRTNILQFQGGVSIFNREAEQVISIDPVKLRQANLVMKVSDGLNPSDKIIDGETLTAATQFLATNQDIGKDYNVGDMFAYLFQSRGLKLSSFKKPAPQVAYEQAIAQWQGAVGALAESLQKAQVAPEKIQEILASMPQPTPEQFGYTPGVKSLTPGAATTPNSPSLLSSMGRTVQESVVSTQAAQAAKSNQAPEA